MMKILSLLLIPTFCFAQIDFTKYPEYKGKDLGVTYSKAKTVFKVWAPDAISIKLRLFKDGSKGLAYDSAELKPSVSGCWELAIAKDLKHIYYTFQVSTKDKMLSESPDIYAKALGLNGKRGMVVDLKETNPAGWDNEQKPALKEFTDIVLYESHLRDISMATNSGIAQKGKYLGMAETGTHNEAGQTTGLDHLKEMGITHVHILPSYDFNSVDESNAAASFNWGYDPVNYNVPEGSYSTNAADGNVRIKEFKTMVQALHANGIRVVLDMVYNHTAHRETPFNQFAPGYFYRFREDGTYSDASGCGNETASERAMVRKFICESAAYWANEYHVDGFRFDLMGVHDITTMNSLSDTLHKIDSTIFIYGEGWTAGASPYPEKDRAVKRNTYQLDRIAAFCDEMRDALHGPYNKVNENGFSSGKTGTAESIKFGIVAATQHPQVDNKKVNYSQSPWAKEPYQCINYVSCHDDNTLFDRLKISNPTATTEELIQMDKLCQAAVLTSQGIPFIHSGAEFLRSKNGIANSYNSPDSINQLDWERKTTYTEVVSYYKNLIALRKKHPAFRMNNSKLIREHLKFIDTKDSLLVAYELINHANGDAWENILVALNGNRSKASLQLPGGTWIQVLDGYSIKEKGLNRAISKVEIQGFSAAVFIRVTGK